MSLVIKEHLTLSEEKPSDEPTSEDDGLGLPSSDEVLASKISPENKMHVLEVISPNKISSGRISTTDRLGSTEASIGRQSSEESPGVVSPTTPPPLAALSAVYVRSTGNKSAHVDSEDVRQFDFKTGLAFRKQGVESRGEKILHRSSSGGHPLALTTERLPPDSDIVLEDSNLFSSSMLSGMNLFDRSVEYGIDGNFVSVACN